PVLTLSYADPELRRWEPHILRFLDLGPQADLSDALAARLADDGVTIVHEIGAPARFIGPRESGSAARPRASRAGGGRTLAHRDVRARRPARPGSGPAGRRAYPRDDHGAGVDGQAADTPGEATTGSRTLLDRRARRARSHHRGMRRTRRIGGRLACR